MKNMKKLIAVLAAVGVLGTAGVVFADTIKTPGEVLSGLTGKTVEDISKERTAGNTYGSIAKDAGKLDEFKSQMLEQKKAILDERVKDGVMTQQQADEMYNAMKSNQALCDGTGNAGFGRRNGAGFGMGRGMGQGICGGAGFGAQGSTTK